MMNRFIGWRSAAVAAAAALAVAMPGAAAAQAASASRAPQQPRLRLIVAQHTVTNESYQGQVQLDPGIWFASLGANFRLNVSAATYGKPNSLTEILRNGRTVFTRRLPLSLLDGFNGLKNFFRVTLHNATGKQVYSELIDYCPDNYDPERVSGNGPFNSPYPTECAANGAFIPGYSDPFSIGEVWGLASGWATDPTEASGIINGGVTVPLGTYTATENVTTTYSKLLRITAADRSASDTVVVVKGSGDSVPRGASATPRTTRAAARHSGRPLAELPADVPILRHPPASSLPDLIPLPAWGITAAAQNKTTDLLDFSATTFVGGHGQLDVEAFRHNASQVMPAYQYFLRGSKIIGRAPAGTMGYSTKYGDVDHWLFSQFAQYRLLNAKMKLVQDSGKVGFCIAPTDQIDMLLRQAPWQLSFTGFSGACGSQTSLWVREQLPVGWADTYTQTVPGQSFNITKVPNGTYYIEIVSNPGHLLHELNYRNDTSLRKIIIGGTAGHRTVKVPAWNGVDPEG